MAEQKFALTTSSTKLEELKGKRVALTGDLYKGLEQSHEEYANLEEKQVTGATRTKLEQGIDEYKAYTKSIADLAEGLTGGLEQYVDFIATSQNYSWKEWGMSWVSTKTANNVRLKRLKTQSPEENLKLVITYARQLFTEISETRDGACKAYEQLDGTLQILTEKIAEFQPKEAALKERLDALEAEYNGKEQERQKANAERQTELVQELGQLHSTLTQVRHEHGQALTIYKQAQEAYEPNRLSRDSFEQMIFDLGRQATMINEKIENVTEVYMAADQAVKVMMATRGMEKIDRAINYATDKSVGIILNSAAGVADATLKREMIDLIDPEVLKGYMTNMQTTMTDFNQRFAAVRARAIQPPEQKYQ